MKKTEQELQRECDERNRQKQEYIRQQGGNYIGPRRTSHWEVIGGELTSVED